MLGRGQLSGSDLLIHESRNSRVDEDDIPRAVAGPNAAKAAPAKAADPPPLARAGSLLRANLPIVAAARKHRA